MAKPPDFYKGLIMGKARPVIAYIDNNDAALSMMELVFKQELAAQFYTFSMQPEQVVILLDLNPDLLIFDGDELAQQVADLMPKFKRTPQLALLSSRKPQEIVPLFEKYRKTIFSRPFNPLKLKQEVLNLMGIEKQ